MGTSLQVLGNPAKDNIYYADLILYFVPSKKLNFLYCSDAVKQTPCDKCDCGPREWD
jgi:hypothetical protein